MRFRSHRCVLLVGRVDAERLHLSPAPIPESLEDLDGGGLPGAVGPEQCEDVAPLDVEGDVTHRLFVAVGLGQMAHAHCGHSAFLPGLWCGVVVVVS